MIEALSIILKLLDLAAAGAMTFERIQQLRANINAMQAEGRDPSAEELAALLDAIEADTAAIVAADTRLGG